MSRMHLCLVSLLGLVAALCLGGCHFESTSRVNDNWSRQCPPRSYQTTTVGQVYPTWGADGWGGGYYSQPAPSVATVPQFYTSVVPQQAGAACASECKVDLVVRYLLPSGHLRRIMILGVGTNVSNSVIDTDLSSTNRMFHVSVTCALGSVLNAQAEIYDDSGQDIGWVPLHPAPVINSTSQTVTWLITEMYQGPAVPPSYGAPPCSSSPPPSAESPPCRPH